ncbi:MAG: TonB-dependent receptor [Sediminicola sp.]|tara:strand:- start:10685 stop:13741 length:3057 start_codon:yes stop_codon:yes gene_type:complete
MKLKLLLILLTVVPICLLAQGKQISGTVTSIEDGAPLPGTTVLIAGTTNGTTTDFDGRFTLNNVSENDVLSVSYIGFRTLEVPVNGQNNFNISLEADQQQLDEVVILGYTTQKKADITGSVAVVDMDESIKETNSNVLASIQGRVAGVSVSTDGAPGTNANILIRGVGSFGSGNNPLFIIDGVQTDFSSGLNPEDIESIQVLKDAASASIYGARGGNGVILITTKKGKSKEASITFDSYVRFSTIRNKLDMLNAQQYGDTYLQALRNDGNLPDIGNTFAGGNYIFDGTGAVPVDFINQNPLTRSGDTDWQDEVFKTAITKNYDISVSQALDKSRFYFGLGYAQEEGIFVYTNYERYSARLNTDFNLFNDNLTIGENISLSYETRVDPFENRTYEDALFQHPIIPMYDEVGNYGGPAPAGTGDRFNPVGRQFRNKDNSRRNFRLIGDIHAELKIWNGLKTKTIVGFELANTRFTFFEPSFVEGRFNNALNRLREEAAQDINTRYTQLLTYDWNNDSHALEAIAGFETSSNQFEIIGASDTGFFLQNPDFRVLSAGSDDDINFGRRNQSATKSFFGKVNYSLLDRYLFSTTLRRDESSRFGSNNRVGYFPSASIGWRINRESFLVDNDAISDLKLRFSYGQAGNDRIGDYTRSSTFNSDPNYSAYDIGGSNTGNSQGFVINQIGNPNVGWEVSETFNFGLDLGLVNNRLTFTGDYFVRNTKDLLFQSPLLSVEGEGLAPFVNVGEAQNKGFEAVLSYRNAGEKEFQYQVDLNFTAIRNKVVSITEDIDQVIDGLTILRPGSPIGSFFGYRTAGLFRTQSEVDAHAQQPGKGIGRIRYVDTNNDGIVDPEDRVIIGSPFPDFSVGMNFAANYKNFDLSVFVDGTFGNDIYNTYRGLETTFFFETNHSAETLKAFSESNPNSNIPSLTLNNANDELRASDYFIDEGTFIRLKSITFGYSMPKKFMDKLKNASSMRFYFQGQNLLNFTDFNGFDYETGNNTGILQQATYPHAKSIALGVNLKF